MYVREYNIDIINTKSENEMHSSIYLLLYIPGERSIMSHFLYLAILIADQFDYVHSFDIQVLVL